MKKIKVKPATPDLVVLDELNRRRPAEATVVNADIWTRRQIRDGDLVWVDKPKPKEEPSGKAEKFKTKGAK